MEGVEDKGGDVAGYMPLQRQVGFIYDNPNLFIIAHELGHGAFNLRHTFSPESFIAAERTTQNLMDYAGGTELWKHQWEQIRDPQNIWFAWAQDEGEGALITYDDVYVKSIFNEILCAKKNNLSEINVTGYKKLEQQNPGVFWASDLPDAGYIGHFETTLKYASSQSKNTLAINVITQTDNHVTIGDDVNCKLQVSIRRNLNPSVTDAEKLSAYLKADKDETNNHIENLMLQMDGMADIGLQIQKIPDCWFSEISNNRRIEYLKKLSSKADENINYIIKLINTVHKENIPLFFTKLGETSLFYAFHDRSNISFDNYTAFIRAATLLYYQQDGLKDKLSNLPYDRMFVNQTREGSTGASISNSFSPNQTTITITGNVTVVTGTTNPYGVTIPNVTKTFQAYSYPVGYCDLIGLELVSDFGHLKASMHDDVVPLPAFYFDWINTNRQNEANCKMIDVTITIASLAIGVSELKLAIKGGQYIYAAYLGVGTALTTYNLVRLNTDIDTYFDHAARSNPEVKEFFDALDTWSYLFDLSNVVVSRIISKNNKQFFNDFVAAWTVSKSSVYNHILNHSEGGDQKAKEVTGEFEKLVGEIIVELNKQ